MLMKDIIIGYMGAHTVVTRILVNDFLDLREVHMRDSKSQRIISEKGCFAETRSLVGLVGWLVGWWLGYYY